MEHHYTIFIEADASNHGQGVIVRNSSGKPVIQLDAFSQKHAHAVALDLLALLPKLDRKASVVLDSFVPPISSQGLVNSPIN